MEIPRIGLSARASRELDEHGHSDLHTAVGEAIRSVSATHWGRPIDEIESVLREAVTSATHDREILSSEAIHELAEQIHWSTKHA
ncbi:hypothetical protein [Naasia sp. SYSU D00948]|uniref:hypothetical protein n=1 Tax=Naasia sp. SYSU D00948 TaxID=2817379 RepID=UPI001B30E50F|nr:hypothetical protein [Naasia sp. SYSU D00948]